MEPEWTIEPFPEVLHMSWVGSVPSDRLPIWVFRRGDEASGPAAVCDTLIALGDGLGVQVRSWQFHRGVSLEGCTIGANESRVVLTSRQQAERLRDLTPEAPRVRVFAIDELLLTALDTLYDAVVMFEVLAWGDAPITVQTVGPLERL